MKRKRAKGKRYICLVSLILLTAGFLYMPDAVTAEMDFAVKNPAPIGPPESAPRERAEQREFSLDFEPMAPLPQNTFEGINFDENGDITGFLIIPPDPIAAAGPDHIVSVVNSTVEWYTKTGVLQLSLSLENDFFSVLSPQSRPFDPKVIYDQYADRFVVIALERGDFSSPNASRILVGVSDDENPNGTWYLGWINSNLDIGPFGSWADYPGLAIDEEAVYITANMFRFILGRFAGSRLWILEKGDGSGGFYDGGSSSLTLHDPSTAAGLPYTASTLQPAHVFGPGGVAEGVGTFLVSLDWETIGSPVDSLSVIRVDDPLGSPSFSNQFISLGEITGAYDLPDAPQAGTGVAIETNDGRILHAVWRNDSLWAVNTINPSAGPDSGQATAHWYEIDTSALNSLELIQQGNIGGEDIAPGTHTFFPSIAVDAAGNVGIGFAASAPGIFPGSYYTGRKWSDPAGSMQPAETLAAGVDYYIRTFGGGRNRWGDYSGMSVDPADDRTFWVYNQYALTRGTVTDGEDGRWGTRFGSFAFSLCAGDFDNDGVVDGKDLAEFLDRFQAGLVDEDNLAVFAEDFGGTDCL